MKSIILIIIQLALSNSLVNACNCFDPGTVKEAFEQAAIVVQGKVVSIEKVSIGETLRSDKVEAVRNSIKNDHQKEILFETEFVYKVELEIVNRFKGTIESKIMTLYTTLTSASCGFTRFKVEKEFIVYAFPKSYTYDLFLPINNELKDIERTNTYWTNHCTRTTECNDKEIEELVKLKKDN